MGIKKRICNPVAEEVANCGDPKVRGMFIGAGRAAGVIQDIEIRREFERRMVDIEARYVYGREHLAEETYKEQDEVLHWLLQHVGPGGEKLEGKPKP